MRLAEEFWNLKYCIFTPRPSRSSSSDLAVARTAEPHNEPFSSGGCHQQVVGVDGIYSQRCIVSVLMYVIPGFCADQVIYMMCTVKCKSQALIPVYVKTYMVWHCIAVYTSHTGRLFLSILCYLYLDGFKRIIDLIPANGEHLWFFKILGTVRACIYQHPMFVGSLWVGEPGIIHQPCTTVHTVTVSPCSGHLIYCGIFCIKG